MEGGKEGGSEVRGKEGEDGGREGWTTRGRVVRVRILTSAR